MSFSSRDSLACAGAARKVEAMSASRTFALVEFLVMRSGKKMSRRSGPGVAQSPEFLPAGQANSTRQDHRRKGASGPDSPLAFDLLRNNINDDMFAGFAGGASGRTTMRTVLLSCLLVLVVLGLMGFTATEVRAQWITTYSYPTYGASYYPGYSYYYYPGYTTYYSTPGYTTYYSAPGYAYYTPGYTSYYYNPGYATYYSAPMYQSYYAPAYPWGWRYYRWR
jgi:hypothetical protein